MKLREYFEKKLDTYPGKKQLLARLMAWASDKDSFFSSIESNIIEKSGEHGIEPTEFIDRLFSMDVDGWLSRFE